MGQEDKKSFLSKIYESTAHLWNKLVPVSVGEFVARVTNGPESEKVDRVEIDVRRKYEGKEPAFLITYRAFSGNRVLLRAQEKFSCLECKEAHLKAEGKIPERVKKMVWNRTDRKIQEVFEAISNAGIDVDLEIPSSRDTDVKLDQ